MWQRQGNNRLLQPIQCKPAPEPQPLRTHHRGRQHWCRAAPELECLNTLSVMDAGSALTVPAPVNDTRLAHALDFARGLPHALVLVAAVAAGPEQCTRLRLRSRLRLLPADRMFVGDAALGPREETDGAFVLARTAYGGWCWVPKTGRVSHLSASRCTGRLCA
jgi:hypothetical protein